MWEVILLNFSEKGSSLYHIVSFFETNKHEILKQFLLAIEVEQCIGNENISTASLGSETILEVPSDS